MSKRKLKDFDFAGREQLPVIAAAGRTIAEKIVKSLA
jgi:hypothetical protein